MRAVTLFIVFVGLFGPKLFSVIDLSLLAGLAGLVLLTPDLRRSNVPSELLAVGFFLLLITADTAVLIAANKAADLYPIMRQTRALLSTLLLGFVFYNLGKNAVVDPRRFLHVILICLLVNALVILLQIQVPATKSMLAGIVGFDKQFVQLRGFGLTAGYDTAGYLCVFGGLLASMCAYYWKGIWYLLALLLFLVAALFTSRSTMLLASILVVGIIVIYMFRGRPSLKFSAAGFSLACAAVFYFYVLPLLAATFKALEALGIAPAGGSIEFVESFASTGLEAWVNTMWVLPSTTSELLFGAGYDPAHSDLGYVKIIYMIGLVGMTLVAITYAYLFVICESLARFAKNKRSQDTDALHILARAVALLIFSLILLNIKNLYFFTRGYHELIVMLAFAALGYRDNPAVQASLQKNGQVAETVSGESGLSYPAPSPG